MNSPLPSPLGFGVKLTPIDQPTIEKYVRVPLAWVRQAQETGGQFAVVTALAIWYRSCVTRANVISLSNINTELFGINRKQKTSGLKSLSEAGMIRVEYAAGQSPTVTILKLPGRQTDR